MDKKAYIIKVLETIKSDWPIAEGLLILIEQNTLSEEVIDALLQMIQSSIKETDDEKLKNKLMQAKEVFEKIKAAEAQQKILDDQDISALETAIANI